VDVQLEVQWRRMSRVVRRKRVAVGCGLKLFPETHPQIGQV